MGHRRLVRLAAIAAIACLAAPWAAAGDGLEPAGTGGLAEVERALARLDQHRRLLIVGAHPDDEDTTLLALVTRGQGGEAAYLSLTRGEGGQNLIGEELGEALGVLRSEELLAARRLDGGRQLFTRAYDFGYTESLEETFGRWPREALLVDVVRAIRRFRPQVVVSVFPPGARAGHGQHQAAGVLAEEAFRRAGEVHAFPELLEQGLAPWQPELLYREAWFDPGSATLELPSGELDPLSGHTVFQLAMASRSLHRSQSMGAMQSLEARPVRLTAIEPPPGAAAGEVAPEGLFGGLDTRLPALAALAPEEARPEVAERLERVAELVAAARRELAPSRLGEAVPRLAAVLAELRAARQLAPEGGSLDALLGEKEEAASEALAAAAGVVLDATTGRSTVIPGDRLEVAVTLWNGGSRRLRVDGLRIEETSARRWTFAADAGEADPGTGEPSSLVVPEPLAPGGLARQQALVSIDGSAVPTMPYFLSRPRQNDWYDLTLIPAELAGEPFEPPLLEVVADLELLTAPGEAPDAFDPHAEPVAAGTPIRLRREVVAVSRDLARGERRLPLRVVPRLEVRLTTSLLVWPLDDPRPRRIGVELLAHGAATGAPATAPEGGGGAAGGPPPYEGRLEVALPEGWPAIEPIPFRVTPGERVGLEVLVRPPAELVAGRSRVEVVALERRATRPPGEPPPASPPEDDAPAPLPVAATGDQAAAPTPADAEELEWWTSYDTAFPLVEYEHVRPRPVPLAAHAVVSAFPLRMPSLDKVAYVRGAADYVPEALLGVGVPLELVTAEELAQRELGGYDAIVVGPRAYESSPALARAHARLDDYVRRGGLLIVQYQRWEYFQQGLPPVPMVMDRRGAGRTTDETAPVRVLVPEHLALTSPNPIGDGDWEGWVQERGLYYPQSWDPLYAPLLAMADPGRDELSGALLVAPHGRGTFVYTGLAFFRQLPAGVPGAYRLFANLLALARPQVEEEDLPWDEP